MKFCFRPTDAPEKERLYICDFSHGRLNVRLSARIQPLLRGHKYGLFIFQRAVLWMEMKLFIKLSQRQQEEVSFLLRLFTSQMN